MNKGHYTLETKLVHLYAKVAIGSTGACTLDVANSKGIASITRTSAGLYVLTTSAKFNRLEDFRIVAIDSTLQDITFQVNTSSISAKTITFWCKTGATATDPQSGCELRIALVMKDSSV